ncbi:DUF7695 domain-containing protein [Rhodococcus qingshengii]|uniref:DUF7695 domain-containing protein n=1 Tax=Rhodococcus qingshengii TaxID=334542 RepID=UPI00294347AB|nr:hypothetical protein [Rhodococcus qingshengii]WOI85964.1 hypothetical protein R0122_22560 [Rhodococcus qingshengii]
MTSAKDKPKIMVDGTVAWLSPSKRYYVRRYRLKFARTPRQEEVPSDDDWTHIAYFDVETKERIALASATCTECNATIESKHCGDYVWCECRKSAVDTDRMMPERHRFIGCARGVA